MPGDVYDYAPPAFVRWTETFWSLHGPTFDRDQSGLELGSYRGETLLRVAPFIGRMTGLETSPEDAAEARRRCAKKPGLDPRGWSGLAIPFPDAHFDLVFVDWARPGFVPRAPEVLLAEARRVLKADGRFLALALRDTDEARSLRDAWTDRLVELGAVIDELPPLKTADGLRAELAAAGFEPKIETLGPELFEIQGDV